MLDGGPGVAAIPDTDDGRWDADDTWDRAVGPMQFIPSSWSIHGQDGNRDGRRDPNNVVDAALASGGYLCAGDRDVDVEKERRAAVFSYNHSWDYVDLVLAWADAYAGGTPVLTGSLGALTDDDPSGRHRGSGGDGSADDGADGAVTAISAPASAAPVAEPTAEPTAAGGGATTPRADGRSRPARPSPRRPASPQPGLHPDGHPDRLGHAVGDAERHRDAGPDGDGRALRHGEPRPDGQLGPDRLAHAERHPDLRLTWPQPARPAPSPGRNTASRTTCR